MKKILRFFYVFVICFCIFFCLCACSSSVLELDSAWTPVKIEFCPPFFSDSTPVYGLQLGTIYNISEGSKGLSISPTAALKDFSGLELTPLISQRAGTSAGVFISLFAWEHPVWFSSSILTAVTVKERLKSYEEYAVNYGLNLNLTSAYIYLQGVAFSLDFDAYQNDGVSLSLKNIVNRNNGLLIGMVNSAESKCSGVEIGILNSMSNYVDDSQLAYRKKDCGYFGNSFSQIGIFNFLKKKDDDLSNGFQLGVINKSNAGIQFGLINIKPNSKLFTVMPFCNW